MRSRAATFTRRIAVAAVLASLAWAVAAAQSPSALATGLQQIFRDGAFAGERFGPAVWLDRGASYALLEGSGDSREIVAYDTTSGRREVLADRALLTPSGAASPLTVEGYEWSADRQRALIFTNSRRVWRQNTRGDFWLLDRRARTVRKLGGDAPESSLMFAKLSPDATRAAYVRDRNLYVEDLTAKSIVQLTSDGSSTIINGTSDWVNEEELDIRDGFRWSPDGKSIAYWQFDTSGVGEFTLIDDTSTQYPTLTRFPYPKVGTTNSAVRAGVVAATGGQTRWIRTPGDPRNTYIAKMQWTADSSAVLIQQLNRLQNVDDLLSADPATGDVRQIVHETDRAWVETVGEIEEIDKDLTWVSERDGWRHLYRVARDGSGARLVTRFNGDVLDGVTIDSANHSAYVMASPESAISRYLYRVPLDGGTPARVTPAAQRGTHGYDISPDAHWAFHTSSTADTPARVELVSLPDHHVVRVLAENAGLASAVAPMMTPPTEFISLDIGDGVVLDGSLVKPADFDASKKYPVIVYVYGEPASQTVVDRWGGSRGLFHRALANQGYVIASFDNHGTPAPRGAAWRKVVYGAVGELASKEQAAAVSALAARFSWVDRDRVGVWGWSGGGSNTLNAMFRYADVFKVGVSVAPVPDQRLYDTIYQERYMGLPADNADGYRRGSSINFADGLKGRLLVVHGSGDDNVHFQGTERLINRLVELGKPFDVMVYPNRTHAISEGPGTSLHVHSLIARYFLEHLTPGPKGADSTARP